MILRRFMKHVTDQNWFAVGLDVIVVIVGIFLGLQVQAWYEFQNDRQLEQIYLERLLDDADTSIAALGRNITIGERQISTITKVNQLMLNHQVSEDNRGEFSDNFYSSRGFSSMDVYLTTIEEIISSGQVTLIQSQEIRNAIGVLRKEYDVLNNSQLRVAENISATYLEVDDFIEADEDGGTILNPLEDLNGDSPLFRKMRSLQAIQGRHSSLNVRMTNYLTEYREKILSELEKKQ